MERAAHTGWFFRRDTSCASAAKSLTEIARKRAHFRTDQDCASYSAAWPGCRRLQRRCIAADGRLAGAAADVFSVAATRHMLV
jgi:hypothetical protein